MTEGQGYLKTPAHEPPKWERELRIHLATMCVAAMLRKEGDLKQATDMVIGWVEDHAAAILKG